MVRLRITMFAIYCMMIAAPAWGLDNQLTVGDITWNLIDSESEEQIRERMEGYKSWLSGYRDGFMAVYWFEEDLKTQADYTTVAECVYGKSLDDTLSMVIEAGADPKTKDQSVWEFLYEHYRLVCATPYVGEVPDWIVRKATDTP